MRWWSTSNSFSRHRTSWHNQKHFLGITPSSCFPLHIPAAGQCQQHQWLWVSDAGASHVSVTPDRMWLDLMLCCSSNPALKTLQVPDHLHAREVLTDQSSFERRQVWSSINKANFVWEDEVNCESLLKEKSSRESVVGWWSFPTFFLPSFFPSVSPLLSSKAKLRGPKQLYARKTSWVWQSFTLTFSPQARNT